LKLLVEAEVCNDDVLAFLLIVGCFKAGAATGADGGLGSCMLDDREEAEARGMRVSEVSVLPSRMETGCGFGFWTTSLVGFTGRRSFGLTGGGCW
jgi:hypothetical protein